MGWNERVVAEEVVEGSGAGCEARGAADARVSAARWRFGEG